MVLPTKSIYANMMYDGSKLFEYRRNIFRPTVERIYIYETAPVSMITGVINVDSILRAPLHKLWEMTQERGGISREQFNQYFAGRGYGHAIKVGTPSPCRYYRPEPLSAMGINYTPQSFVYIPLNPWLQ